MENEVKSLLEKYPNRFELEILQFDDLKAKGLNLLSAVGQGNSRIFFFSVCGVVF
jgi:leucyl aminopeptidase